MFICYNLLSRIQWLFFKILLLLNHLEAIVYDDHGLLFLFGAVSVVAADFFCPNLQTISSKLRLSESMAGVTVLAFGNGSPDLFSTFTGSGSLAIGELIGAAFFIVSVVSGCMGIIRPFRSKRITFMRDASFLTGAIMILTWIVYHRRICWYHGVLLIAYYLAYVIVVVMGAYRFPGTETPVLPEPKSMNTTQELLSETSRLLSSSQEERRQKPPRLDIPTHGFSSQEHLGHIIKPVSPNSSYPSRKSSFHSNFPRTTSTNGSISSRLYRHAMSPRIGMRTSLFSAIEFQEQVTSIRRANSTQLMSTSRTSHPSSSGLIHRSSQKSVPCISSRSHLNVDHFWTARTPESSQEDYFTFISANSLTQDDIIPEIRLAPPASPTDQEVIEEPDKQPALLFIPEPTKPSWITDVVCVLFPTLQDWSTKTTFGKLNALVAVPIVFILTLTLPVTEADDIKVDDIEVIEEAIPQVVVNKSYLTVPTSESYPDIEEEEEPINEAQLSWCRWLLATQAICSTTFIACVMSLNGFIPSFFIFIGFLAGCILSGLVLYYTKEHEPPRWYWMLSFAGFIIALNWIFLLANEMVGLLQALGVIFDISEAIMGLTIFALGNSVGDLVANTAIAKMGFPTMAISACYAGPLLNMVLGVGISSTYQTWITSKPYELDIAPTIMISSCGLITVLLSTLVVVNINGYHINEGLGWWMIIVYSTCCIVNVLLEFRFLR
ncbi:hypothetical protein RMCBS344292_07383 [Rhizopus microsporus]|nr:hypothetical protein RMCBS344292_07383 [Rhizopus microsporus]